MKIFILTDLEGTAGVTKWSQVTGSTTEEAYKQSKTWMTREVNAAVEGLLEAEPG